MTTQQIENSLLELHAPGQCLAILSYIAGEGDFPTIDLSAMTGWRREFVTGGHLRQYVERLRTVYENGLNSEGTYLVPAVPHAVVRGWA